MRAKGFVVALLGAVVVGALVAPASVAGAKKAAKVMVIGTDPAGDWGANVDPTIAPIGDVFGQDLTAAEMSFDGKNVNFIIKVNALPPSGGMPEFTRYSWNFNVDGEALDLDGKFTNYSRGACDPTAGNCPPPRDPGMQPFVVRGNCTTQSVGVALTTCEEFAKVQGVFDAQTGSITIPVPLKSLKAKKGSKITPGTGTFGGTISAAPSAFLTSGNFPLDTLVVTKTFTVR
jgi:hypothetical protein